MRRFLGAIFLSLLCCRTVWAGPEDELIRVRMEAKAPGTDLRARNAAIKSAEKAIVLQVLESIVGESGAQYVPSLLDNPSAYIHSTRLLRQDQSEATMTVEIESYVRERQLRADAARILLDELPWKPAVLLLAVEAPGTEIASVSEKGTAQKTLRAALEKAHMEVTGPGELLNRMTDAQLAERIRGDLPSLQQFAQENIEDVVLCGEAVVTAEPPEAGRNVFANKATVTLRLLRTADGKLIEASTQEAVCHSADPAEGGRQAIEDACGKLVQSMEVAIVLATVDMPRRTDLVVTIQGPVNRARLDAIAQTLGGVHGVADVREVYCMEQEARFRVSYDGPMAPLVDALTLHDYVDFSLDARRVVQRSLTATIEE